MMSRVTGQGEPRRYEAAGSASWGATPFSRAQVDAMRRTRRNPRRTQFDYLHVRHLLDDLAEALLRLGEGVENVLDVYCGTRPYDNLLPRGATIIGLDIPGNPYGVADVVSHDFLPFPDESFDLVMCIEGFHYVPHPQEAVVEIRRVLRPGGHALIAVPFVWEYDRAVLERRFTGPELADLFREWEDIEIIENGGRSISWATLTGSLVQMVEVHLPRVVRPVFAAFYALLNSVGGLMDRLERRRARSSLTLPMNLLLTARRPDRVES
jgi:SAM-dependent methyltransferase